MFEGEGGDQGPDLTHAGKERDAQWLREWIADPEAMDELADMPAFIDRLTPEELTAIADYLATRK
jgi:mono/diheme cytochrome c family protein